MIPTKFNVLPIFLLPLAALFAGAGLLILALTCYDVFVDRETEQYFRNAVVADTVRAADEPEEFRNLVRGNCIFGGGALLVAAALCRLWSWWRRPGIFDAT